MTLTSNWLNKKHREISNMFANLRTHSPGESTLGENRIIGAYATVQGLIELELEKRNQSLAIPAVPPPPLPMAPCDRCSEPTERIPASVITLCQDCVMREAHGI